MKTSAETLRELMDQLAKASGPQRLNETVHLSESLSDALSDLHKESKGTPTQALADEIASDYGLTGQQLMRAYPAYAETQKNKAPVEPVSDPKKAKQKADYDARTASNQATKDLETRRAEYKKANGDKKAEFKANHADEQAKAQEAIAAFTNVPGWTEVETPEADFQPYHGNDVVTIQKDNITITLWAEIQDKSTPHYDPAHPFSIEGHVVFKDESGKGFTYTKRGIEISSFSAGGRYGEEKEIDASAILAAQEDRVAKSLERGKNMVEVPGTHGIRINKDQVAKIAANINAGKMERLMPSGMGIGWELTNKPSRWSRPAPQEMKDFFGLDKLFMMQQDAD